MIIKNAIIEDIFLGFEHGSFTFMITLEYGDGGHQGFGGYVLGGDWGCEVLKKILNTFEVNDWNKLKGQPARVKFLESGYNRKISEIGHYLKDNWVNFDDKKL
jgi:hypothetical protein